MKTKKKGMIALLCVLVLGLVGMLGAPWLMALAEEVTFYWFDHTEAELKVKAYAEEKGIFYSEYPDSLIDLLARNPETEEFVLNYPFREDAALDLSEYENSETVPLFLQWDPQWGYTKYGSDVIGITGCGPTCLAMAGYYLTGDADFNPEQVAEFAYKNGYYETGYGSSWTLISEGGVKLGLDVTEIPLVKGRMVENLEVGNPIILAMGKGDFTTTGHYIVLTGLEDGKFRVNDPNSVENSEKLWSYEEIESQIRNIWVIRNLT